jgi:uncharacterized membrane protein
MNTISTHAVLDALDALRDARIALGASTAPGHHQIAERIAVAEGRLRGNVWCVLPKALEISQHAA